MNRHDTNLQWNTKVDNQNFLCTKSTRDGAPPLPGKPKLSNGSKIDALFLVYFLHSDIVIVNTM